MYIGIVSQVESKHSPIEVPFDSAASDVLSDLRRTCAAVLTQCGGISKAVDLSTRLGLDRSLGWKVWHVAQGPGPCPSVAHIPGRQGFAQFIRAAREAGVAPGTLDDASRAFDQFRDLTREHAGDRATAESMLGHLSDDGRKRLEIAMRRDGFRAQAHFLGVQAQAKYQLDLVLPAKPGFMPELARVRALLGFRRHRSDVSWLIARSTLVHDEGPSGSIRREPLEPQLLPGELAGIPLLPQFCSKPLPSIRRRIIAGVTAEDELLPGSVGHHGAVDIVTGELASQMPARDVLTDATLMHLTTPCERCCYDVALPRELASAVSVRVQSTVQVEHPYLRSESFATIPVIESLERLGRADRAPTTAEVPPQAALLHYLFARMRVEAKDFELVRLRMRFPPTPSVIGMTYRLK